MTSAINSYTTNATGKKARHHIRPKRGRWKWRTWKWRTINIARHEIARHDKSW